MIIEISLKFVFILLFLIVAVITNLMNWWFRKCTWGENDTSAFGSAVWIVTTALLTGGTIRIILELL